MTLLFLLLAPFSTGVISAFARTRRAMEAINLAGFAVTFVLALVIAGQVLSGGPVTLWGAFLYADHLSALVCLLTASVALVCSVYAVGYLREDERSGALDEDEAAGRRKLVRYYIQTPLFICAMLLVAVANNLGVMWVAIEATTLASVFLVTFYGKVTSIEAAWKYAIIGGVGLSMALFGTVLTYYSGHRLPGADTLAGSELVRARRTRSPTRSDDHAPRVHPDAARLRNESGTRADAHLEAGCLQRSSRARGGHPFFGHAELRPLRPDPLLHPHQPLPRPGFPRRAAAAVRHSFDGHIRPVRAGTEKLPPPACVSHHRSRGHHGDRARRWRETRCARPDAAHDVSHGGQVAAVPLRGQRLPAFQDRPVPQDQGRRAPVDAGHRHGVSHGYARDCRACRRSAFSRANS